MMRRGGFLFTLTLLAPGSLRPSHAETARALLADSHPGGAEWLEPGFACNLPVERWSARDRALLIDALPDVDVIAQRTTTPAKKLFVADMDSTMITVECIDELADFAGLKPEVAAITEQAMRGELPFREALEARVAILAGLTLARLEECRRTRVRLAPGALALVQTLAAHGAHCLLVSGGFTVFAGPVAAELGFHELVANVLETRDGQLTGRVVGPIVDGERKRAELMRARDALGAGPDEVLAIGDGANDLPMIREAGLGLAYRAKPVLAEAADAELRHSDLSALLWALGIPRADWVT